ncbi:DUF87 domain-containing protein [Patescibacteria group bacterium]|nr:MAG: DUF87 domain-containing protein [Patescibacteria group bacterium]
MISFSDNFPMAAAIILTPILIAILIYGLRFYFHLATRHDKGLKKKVFLVSLPRWTATDQSTRGAMTKEELASEIAKMENVFAQIGGLWPERGIKTFFSGRGDDISFELVADKNQISFYVAVPPKLNDFIERHLHAQYPHALIEEAGDYNIFTPSGIVLGTELILSKPQIFPILTYRKLDGDPLSALTQALSKLEEPNGAAIQILVRTAPPGWHNLSKRVAQQMHQGKKLQDALRLASGNFIVQILNIFFPPGQTKKNDDKLNQAEKTYVLTPMEQEVVKVIEEKNSKAGMEVNIRVIASCDTIEKTKEALATIVDSFAPFSQYEYGNGFGQKKRRQDWLIRDFIYRIFNRRRSFILNTEELSSIFHLPHYAIETPNINWLLAKKFSAPPNLPQEGIMLGKNSYRGDDSVIRLKPKDRQRHMYIIGSTGTGKSVLLSNMAIQDIRNGHGVAVIDPHGSLVDDIIENIPKERAEDVVYFDPSDLERPVGLNMLEANTPNEMDFASQEMISIFYKLVSDPAMIGPMFEHNMRNAMLTLMSDKEYPGTIAEVPRIFTDPAFQKYKLTKVSDPMVRAFWEKEMAKTSDFHKSEMLGYLISKVGRFVENEMMRNIIGQPKSGFNLREIMDAKKILLVNLSKGKVGEMNSNLLGLIIVSKLQMAALARADMPEEQRKDFFLYIDEFQNFITDSISVILAEARKYRLNLIMAHQYIGQLSQNNDTRVRDAIFGNVGTIAAFRVGVDDTELLEKQFAPEISAYDLLNIDKYNAYIRILIDNAPTKPFNMATFAPPKGSKEIASVIKQLSRLKYGRDRAEVSAEILERSKLAETSRPEATMQERPSL